MLHGLVSFHDQYAGPIWLEVFILGGYTAIPAEARRIAEQARAVRPDPVQLNTVTRPPAEELAAAVDRSRLEEIAAAFDPPAEVVADYRGVHGLPEFGATREAVLDLLARRPCSLDDIVAPREIKKGPAYVFGNAGIEERPTGQSELADALAELRDTITRGFSAASPD